MNVITLKTLSLSTLMTSGMICAVFAMETPEIDNKPQISSVRNAGAMFAKGDSPVRKAAPTPKYFPSEGESKASGMALLLLNEQNESKARLAKVKSESDQKLAEIESELMQKVATARASADQKIAGMEAEMETKRQTLQTELDALNEQIASKSGELERLRLAHQSALNQVEDAKNDALLTKSGVASAAATAASYFNPKAYFSSKK